MRALAGLMSIHLVDAVTGNLVFHCSHRRARGPVHIVHSENWVTVSTLLPPDTPTLPPATPSPTPAWQPPAGARAGTHRTLGELGHGEYPPPPRHPNPPPRSLQSHAGMAVTGGRAGRCISYTRRTGSR